MKHLFTGNLLFRAFSVQSDLTGPRVTIIDESCFVYPTATPDFFVECPIEWTRQEVGGI